jgi:hypothetical protein
MGKLWKQQLQQLAVQYLPRILYRTLVSFWHQCEPEMLQHQILECNGMRHLHTGNSLGKLSTNSIYSKESYYNGAFAFSGRHHDDHRIRNT